MEEYIESEIWLIPIEVSNKIITGKGFPTALSFLKSMDKNWGCGYSIIYDDELNMFKVMEPNGDFYKLDLDEIVMENYKIGNYNEFTYKLKKLIDKKTGRRSKKYELIGQFIDDKKTLEIVKDAKKGIFNSDNDKKIYLEYLENSKRKSMSMKHFFSNLLDNYKYIVTKLFKNTDSSYLPSLIFILYLGIINSFIHGGVLVILLFILTCFLTTSFFNFKKTLQARNKIKKSLNHAINELELDIEKNKLIDDSAKLQLNEGKKELVNEFAKTGDYILDELLEFSKRIARVKKNDNIDDSEISRLEAEIKNISKEYMDGKIEIVMQGLEEEIQLGGKSEFSLQSDIIKKIATIELRLTKLEEVSSNIYEFDGKCQEFESAMTDILDGDIVPENDGSYKRTRKRNELN